MMKETWKKPKTTKAYLHRPLSERIAIICPDFKLLTLPLLDNGTHVGQPGIGLLFLHGEDMVGFDLDETAWREVDFGLPIYEIKNRGETDVSIEAFAGGERNPAVYFKVTLSNNTKDTVSSKLGLMPRSGQEKYMVNQHQEGYSPYRPNYKNWFMLKRTWKSEGDHRAASDLGHLLVNPNGLDLEWITDSKNGHSFAASDYFELSYTLQAGERAELYGALRGECDIDKFDYYRLREECVCFWQSIADKIKHYPNTTDDLILGIFKHSVIQCTQMIARYKDKEAISVRQGDIARFVWPYEGAQVLVNLERAGISDYSADAFRGYFDRWLVKDGDDRGKIGSTAGWDNFTGSVMWGLSEHLIMSGTKEEFEEFLPYLLMMRDYIEKKRHESRDFGYNGIFPSGTGSDWSERGQFWTFTDSHNCMALRSMCKVLKLFGSAEYESTHKIYTDYSTVIVNIRDELFRGHENDDTYILPHMLGVPFEDSENYSYYTDGAPYLLYTGFIDPKSDIAIKMENFFRRRGQFEKGLTGRMTSCASMWDEAYFGGYGDVWYTMQSETYWVRAWMASGQIEKAIETLNACLTYGMTDEFIVAERYCSINPWYNPWQPNGSGTSRVIEMMLDIFK